jgi:hypothetical protein
MSQVKDQVLIVLADYQSCKRDEIDEKLDLNLESETNRVSMDIASRVMKNYAILSGRKNVVPFMTLAQAAIEIYVQEQASLKRDPWALSRNEGIRLSAAKDIVKIIEDRSKKYAGKKSRGSK